MNTGSSGRRQIVCPSCVPTLPLTITSYTSAPISYMFKHHCSCVWY